jgi:rhodanese-related sulfurtransferase
MKNLSRIIILLSLLFFFSPSVESAQVKQSKLNSFTKLNSLKKYDASLMISATTIMQKIKQKNSIFLVDIRHKAQFNKFKIPGSINLSLSFIKTKQFLKTKPIALIYKGFGYYEIEKEVKNLNKKGFDIKILQGGLAAWKHRGGSIVGDPFSQKKLNKMPVKDFFMEKEYEERIIINACAKPSKKTTKLIPKAIHIPTLKSNLTTNDFIKKSLSIPKNNSLTAVIIFNETGQDYSSFEKNINKAFTHKVFYLQGGIKAYQSFINSQKLAGKPKAQRIREVGHCEPCKKKDNQ